MGCYDDIKLNCPKCGAEYWAQSKGGDCSFKNYELNDCPEDVLSDANRHAPYECDCGTIFEVDTETRQTVISKSEEHHPDSFQGQGGFGITLPDGKKI